MTLKDAEQLALKNHPRVLEVQSEVLESSQVVRETRAAYYPALSGVLTGSQGDRGGRIGSGALPASQLFDRFGQGVLVSQLITDSGRTPNLVATSKLHAQAIEQSYQATQFDVLLGVNTSFFDVLRDQALVRVAQETVSARQLLSDQVTTLAQNNLRSQLDVSFADVNVADARLLLLTAQNNLQDAYAQMARALGSDQAVEYQLVDEPLPASLPTDPNAAGGSGHRQSARCRSPAVRAGCGVQVRECRGRSGPANRQRGGRRGIPAVHQPVGHCGARARTI